MNDALRALHALIILLAWRYFIVLCALWDFIFSRAFIFLRVLRDFLFYVSYVPLSFLRALSGFSFLSVSNFWRV